MHVRIYEDTQRHTLNVTKYEPNGLMMRQNGIETKQNISAWDATQNSLDLLRRSNCHRLRNRKFSLIHCAVCDFEFESCTVYAPYPLVCIFLACSPRNVHKRMTTASTQMHAHATVFYSHVRATHTHTRKAPQTHGHRVLNGIWMRGEESMLAPCCSKAEYGFSENTCASSQRTQPKS